MLSPVKIWRNQRKIAKLVGKTGTIISWTIIRTPPADFVSQAPYPVVLVELDDKTRLTSQLVDWREGSLRIGQKVVTIIRRITEPNVDGIIPYGIKVKPVDLDNG